MQVTFYVPQYYSHNQRAYNKIEVTKGATGGGHDNSTFWDEDTI